MELLKGPAVCDECGDKKQNVIRFGLGRAYQADLCCLCIQRATTMLQDELVRQLQEKAVKTQGE